MMGGIGSGKSFIAKLFKYPVFNADQEVNKVYRKNKNCYNQLKKRLPKFIKSFPIKKSELIEAVSSNRKNIKIISSIVHPIVRKKMGKFLKTGEFDNLFNLVGLINQTDPYQEYLKDSEKIFKYRFKLNNRNPDYLYNIAIAQVLQRKSIEAASTLEELIKFEKNNSNLYLAKSVVDIYNFNPKKAERNIQNAININNNPKLNSTINTIKIISNIINFRIRSLINI